MKPLVKPMLLTTSLLVILLFLIATTQVKAAADNKPIFATIQYVQQAISSALSPVQSSIKGLTNRLSNLEATVTPMPGQIANIQATLTPIPEEIANLQATQASQASQISSLQTATSKSLQLLDKNGTELGIVVSTDFIDNTQIFIPSLGKAAIIIDGKMPRTELLYTTNDCSGTPYMPYGSTFVNPPNNIVYSLQPGVYFTGDPNGIHTQQSINSWKQPSDSTNAVQCQPAPYTPFLNQTFPVIFLSTPPFSEPFATPLQYRYQ